LNQSINPISWLPTLANSDLCRSIEKYKRNYNFLYIVISYDKKEATTKMAASANPSHFDDGSSVDTGDNGFPASASEDPHQANQNIKGM